MTTNCVAGPSGHIALLPPRLRREPKESSQVTTSGKAELSRLCFVRRSYAASVVDINRPLLQDHEGVLRKQRGERTMEPLLAIIVAVAGAFGNDTLNDTARRTISDLWDVAKKIIVAKFGVSPRRSSWMKCSDSPR